MGRVVCGHGHLQRTVVAGHVIKPAIHGALNDGLNLAPPQTQCHGGLPRMNGMLKAMSPRLREWIPASVAIVLAMCIAVFVWNQRQDRLRNDLQADFSFESRELAVRLQERMRAHKQVLRGVRAALSTMGVPSRVGWTRYVANQFLDVDFPGMQGLGYAARIPTSDVSIHEARMKANGYPGYAVAGAGSLSKSLAPVVRLAPDSPPNLHLLGVDLLNQEGIRSVLSDSAEQAGTLLSAPVWLRVPGADISQPLVFMVQPIFAPHHDSADAKASHNTSRSAYKDGWVFAVFRAPQLIRATLGELPPGMHLRVFSDRSLDSSALIFESRPLATQNWGKERLLSVTTDLELDGQTWTLVFEGFPRTYLRNGSFNWEFFSILAICALFGLSAVLITLTRSASRKLLGMTGELQISNDRYQFLATHDALTQLANRVLFQSRLDITLAEAARYQRRFALIYIDLDKFKPVNDLHGHEVGDALLKAVALRLMGLLRESDLLARRGGDEFVILLPSIGDAQAVQPVAHKICSELSKPFELDGVFVEIGASLGIVTYPVDGDNAEQLIVEADRRMYQAKQAGGNQWMSRMA